MRRFAIVLILLAACTSAPPNAPPVAISTPSPSPSPPPTLRAPAPAFSVDNVITTITQIASGIGPRPSVTPAFRRAVALVRDLARGIGYNVRVIAVPVPAGRVRGVPQPAGTTYDVIAEPVGYEGRRPHIVVGGHLDTVPGSPGANDNASGVAVSLELARLAKAAKFKFPVVFVAFGAEESIVQHKGVLPPKYGSRAYIASLSAAERWAILGVFNIDMVGAGSLVHLGNSGVLWSLAFEAARPLGIKVAVEVSALSDHTSFEAAHIPVVWFWSGRHPTFHLPSDRVGIIQREEIARIGALAWATMRAMKA